MTTIEVADTIRGRVLWVEPDGGLLLGDDEGGLVRWHPERRSLIRVAKSGLPPAQRWIGRARLLARLARQAPRCCLRSSTGTLLWTAGGQLWRQAADAAEAQSVFEFAIGHGPLFLAQSASGELYWGEYIATRHPQPCALYGSTDDGRTWQTVYRFGTDQIRHIHGVFWDDCAGQIWLTTGDAHHESGLWVLEPGGPRLFAGGHNLYRIVQPLFTERLILFGKDTPGEDCGLYSLERATGKVELLSPVRGPVFFGSRAGRWVAFSTVVEPSHPEREAGLYVADVEALAFQEVLRLRKDPWEMRLFQYGQIFLPHNANAEPVFWLSPCATAQDGRLLRLAL